MNLTKILILSILSGAIFTGCTPSAKESIDTAVYEQKISNNPCAASSACTNAFSEAQKKLAEPGQNNNTEFCNELLKREDADLAICEVDIRNEKFQNVIASCKSSLMQRLAKISKDRNMGIHLQAEFASEQPFNQTVIQKLPTQIQYRDTSKGYLAITGDVKPKQVVLTFDDGPDSTNTVSILNTLSRFGAKAHFFELGVRVKANPQVTQQIAAQGHAIGNHSWNHPNMRKISFEESVRQIKKTHSLLHSILGAVNPFFRFPFGNSTRRLDQMLYQNQMADFKWAIDSNDWRMVNKDKSIRTNIQVINDTLSQLDSLGRGIILMHDIHRRTAELLPELLSQMAAKGYSTVILQPTDESLKTNPPLLATDHLP